jgi:ribosomal protein S18 acetylase RimI-like enzyme
MSGAGGIPVLQDREDVKVALVPMSPEEFDRRWALLREGYARSVCTARGIVLDEARAESTRQMAEILPQGLYSDKALLLTARADGVEVGWIWVMLPGAPGRPEMAWIHNIEVDAEHQSKGYGRAMIQAVEADLARRGVDRLGLNVFGHNTRAIRLYESLGFGVIAQQMVKSITTDAVEDEQPEMGGG